MLSGLQETKSIIETFPLDDFHHNLEFVIGIFSIRIVGEENDAKEFL